MHSSYDISQSELSLCNFLAAQEQLVLPYTAFMTQVIGVKKQTKNARHRKLSTRDVQKKPHFRQKGFHINSC